MKKLAFMVVAFAAISLASCNGNKTEAGSCNDSDSVCGDTTAVESVIDTASVDTTTATDTVSAM